MKKKAHLEEGMKYYEGLRLSIIHIIYMMIRFLKIEYYTFIYICVCMVYKLIDSFHIFPNKRLWLRILLWILFNSFNENNINSNFISHLLYAEKIYYKVSIGMIMKRSNIMRLDHGCIIMGLSHLWIESDIDHW